MDAFTREMLESAHQFMSSKKQKIDSRRLLEQAEREALAYRDATIEDWQDTILDSVPQWKLLDLVETVHDQMMDFGEWRGTDLPETDQEACEFAAMGLACLRYMHREMAGRTPEIKATEQQVEKWLEARKAEAKEKVKAGAKVSAAPAAQRKATTNIIPSTRGVLAEGLHEFIMGEEDSPDSSGSGTEQSTMTKDKDDKQYVDPNGLIDWSELTPEIRPLTDDEYGRLKNSLTEHGQKSPVLIDRARRIIDGHHRAKVFIEMGWSHLWVEYQHAVSNDQAREIALSLNMDRRQMSPEEIAEFAEARRIRVAEKKAAGQSNRQIADEEGVSEKTIRNDLAKSGAEGYAPQHKPPSKVTGKDGKQYAASKPKYVPTWLDVWAKRAEEINDNWDEDNATSDKLNKLIFIKTGQSGSTSLVLGDDARWVGKILGIQPAHLEIKTQRTQRYYNAIKFQLIEDAPPMWFKALRRILAADEAGIEFLDLHVSHPDVNQFANQVIGSNPAVPDIPKKVLDWEVAAQQRAVNTLVEHPDPAAAQAAIFGDTPLRSSEGFPIPGAAPRPDGSPAPSDESIPASAADSVEAFLADPSREALLHQRVQQLQATARRLIDDKALKDDRIEALEAEIAILKAAADGNPSSGVAASMLPPTDPDPLREKLIQSLWYLDRGMAALGSGFDLDKIDGLILRHFSDQIGKTVMLLFRAIELALGEEVLDVVRGAADGARDQKAAIDDAIYRIAKEEYISAPRRNGRS